MTGTVYPVPWAGHLRWFRTLKNDPLRKHFAIEKSGGIYIGNTGIKRLDPANRSAELFIYIGEERERGQGAGAAATELLASFCFDRLGLHRIFATVFAYNTAALKTYAKAGFSKEAVLREHLYRSGRYHDVILLGRLKT